MKNTEENIWYSLHRYFDKKIEFDLDKKCTKFLQNDIKKHFYQNFETVSFTDSDILLNDFE